MQRHHTGSGRHKTIEAGWAEHHATAAIGAANAFVTVTGPPASGPLAGGTELTPGWDPTRKATTPATGDPIATDVPARIQALRAVHPRPDVHAHRLAAQHLTSSTARR
jgi:hypothetical protein